MAPASSPYKVGSMPTKTGKQVEQAACPEHIFMRRSTVQGGDSNVALRDSARGVLLWEVH